MSSMTRLQIHLYLEELIDAKMREAGQDPDEIEPEAPMLRDGAAMEAFFQ